MRYATLVFLLTLCCLAQPIEKPYQFRRDEAPKFSAADGAYWGSVAFLIAGHVADHQSSVGRYELNPLLRNSVGMYDSNRGALLKLGVVAGVVVVQRLVIRKHPQVQKWATVANLAGGAVSFGIAARNRGKVKP